MEQDEQRQFTEDEKAVLRVLSQKYKWIARDASGDLNVYKTKPTKSVGTKCWANEDYETIAMFNHAFSAITWDLKDPDRITDLLGEKSDTDD